MEKNAVAGIWIGVGMCGIGMGIAKVQGEDWMGLAVVVFCALIATIAVR